ncbi:MAG TPA: Holliday junction branch migration protein RuvA [Candidatus Binataceae bacterium]|nr:Holliday junction branch migration protein RuvA [Candidatus Binataceae bacterium]
MIATIHGKLQLRAPDRVIVETAGVGYELLIPLSTYHRLPAVGGPVLLEVRQVIREDSWQLYGFLSSGEKRAFDLLMGVQHVGPKLALAILSNLAPDELVAAIGREDAARLEAVKGVGAKVAERIVRELRDKASELRAIAPLPAVGHSGGLLEDALSALINLGYRPAQAKAALESVAPAATDPGEELEPLLRKALAVLAGER